MKDSEYIKLILNKSCEIHNRCNNTVEEIIRRNNGEESIRDLIDSIRYVADDMERIIK